MDCRRAEELFSDHLEGTLPWAEQAALERHLRECGACRLLRAAFGEVVAALHSLPLYEAPRGLAERAAATARQAPAVGVPARMPPWLQATAAVLALAITGGLAAASRAWTPSGRLRVAQRAASAGSFLAERKDRLVEDVRLLRVVVETAFEERFDNVGSRLEDYRRLLERRRALERQSQPPSAGPSPESKREFSNPDEAGRVHLCEAGMHGAPASASPARPARNHGPRRADPSEGA